MYLTIKQKRVIKNLLAKTFFGIDYPGNKFAHLHCDTEQREDLENFLKELKTV